MGIIAIMSALALIWLACRIWFPSPRLAALMNRRCEIESLKKRRGYEDIPEYLREELESAAEQVELLLIPTTGDSMPEELERIDRAMEDVEQRLPQVARRRSSDYDPLICCD
jgi:hypothetical protein